ncbi:MAG: hypothetical protein ACHQEM_01715 [Chitinophagales bacterium]
MNLLQTITKGYTKQNCEKVVQWIGSNKNRFSALMDLVLHADARISQRAAWPMSYCVIKFQDLVKPWFGQIVDLLEKKDTHPALIRNIVRLLQKVDIPKRYQGRIMNACFGFVQSNDQPPAIKAFSLTILENLSKQYPETRQELKIIIEERWTREKAAFRSRARKIINTIKI